MQVQGIVATAFFGWLAWRSWSKAQADLREHIARYGPLEHHSRNCPGGDSIHDMAGPLFLLWVLMTVAFGIGTLIGALD